MMCWMDVPKSKLLHPHLNESKFNQQGKKSLMTMDINQCGGDGGHINVYKVEIEGRHQELARISCGGL